jgi:hypothetical protein
MEITIRSDSAVCPVPNAYVGMQSCTPAMRWWWCVGSANSYPDEVLGSAPQTWLNGLALSHVSRLTLSACQKYSCTVRSIGSLRHLPPELKNHGLNEENLIGKNNHSIESNEVNVWLVWILTTKRKSLKRVETYHEKYFTLWLFVIWTRSSDLIF